MVALFLLLWFYNVLFEVFNNGATPGKRALGLRVMNVNGTPVDWSGSLIRNLDSFCRCAAGLLRVWLYKRTAEQRISRGSATWPRVPLLFTSPGKVLPDRNPTIRNRWRSSCRLSLDEQHAIVSFGERASSLNSERSEELAEDLETRVARRRRRDT